MLKRENKTEQPAPVRGMNTVEQDRIKNQREIRRVTTLYDKLENQCRYSSTGRVRHIAAAKEAARVLHALRLESIDLTIESLILSKAALSEKYQKEWGVKDETK